MWLLFTYGVFYALLCIGVIALKAKAETVIYQSKKVYITFLVAWHDGWLGVFYNPEKARWYIGIPFFYITFLRYKQISKAKLYELKTKLSELPEN